MSSWLYSESIIQIVLLARWQYIHSFPVESGVLLSLLRSIWEQSLCLSWSRGHNLLTTSFLSDVHDPIDPIHRRLLREQSCCKIGVLSNSSMRTWDVLQFGHLPQGSVLKSNLKATELLSRSFCFFVQLRSDLPKGEASAYLAYLAYPGSTAVIFSTWKAMTHWALKMRSTKPPRQEQGTDELQSCGVDKNIQEFSIP